MCLFGPYAANIPPTPKAIQLAKYFKFVVFCQVVLAVLGILAGRYIDSIFLLLIALIGFLHVRSDDGYSLQLSCVFIMNTFYFIWSIILLALASAGVDVYIVPTDGWKNTLFWISVIGGPIFYLFAAVLSKLIYNELRNVLMAEVERQMGDAGMMEGGMGGMGMGGGYGGRPAAYAPREPAQPAAQPTRGASWGGGGAVGGGGGGNPYRDPNYRPGRAQQQPQSQPGFVPFSGEGHKLG
jgi:hypothetical protein